MQRERGNKNVRSVSAFTLVELLIVLVLVSILAKIAISSTTPNAYEELNATASIVSGELMYARGLAVGNNSTYRFDLDTTNNQLVMRNTGSDPTLTTLPNSAISLVERPQRSIHCRFRADSDTRNAGRAAWRPNLGLHPANAYVHRIRPVWLDHASQYDSNLVDRGQR